MVTFMRFFLVFFIACPFFVFHKTAMAGAKTAKDSDSQLEFTFSKQELKNNYKTKELVDFINYSSKYFQTTAVLFDTASLLAPQKQDKEFLSQLKKSFFEKKLYLPRFKYIKGNKIQTVSKKTVIVIKDFKKELYTYNGHLVKFDRTKTIQDNLTALANKLKPAKKTSAEASIKFFIDLIFPSVFASPIAVVAPLAVRGVQATVEFFKSAFTASRLKDVSLWMFAFQTMGTCQNDFQETQIESSSALVCIGAGLLWPAYWGLKFSSGFVGEALSAQGAKTPLENIMRVTGISCPRSYQKDKKMKVHFAGEGLFLDITVHYNKNFHPLNVTISEGLTKGKISDSLKIFVDKKWKKQAVKKSKKESYFEIEESVLLEGAKSFSDYCRKDPAEAEKTVKELVEKTSSAIGTRHHPGIGLNNKRTGKTQRPSNTGRR